MGNHNSGRRPDRARRRQAAALRRQGLTVRQVGERLGVSRQGAAHLLRAAGCEASRCVYALICPRCGREIRCTDYFLRRAAGVPYLKCLQLDDSLGLRVWA